MPAHQGLVAEELACVAHQSIAFGRHHLAAAAAVADTSAAAGNPAVAAGTVLVAVAVAVVDRDRDRHAEEEAAHMHHKAEYLEVDSGRARPYVLGRMLVSEQRPE